MARLTDEDIQKIAETPFDGLIQVDILTYHTQLLAEIALRLGDLTDMISIPKQQPRFEKTGRICRTIIVEGN